MSAPITRESYTKKEKVTLEVYLEDFVRNVLKENNL